MDNVTLYVITHHMAGYLPESEPIFCEDFEDARATCLQELDHLADQVCMGPEDADMQLTMTSIERVMRDLTSTSETDAWCDVVDQVSYDQVWTIDRVTMTRSEAERALAGEWIG